MSAEVGASDRATIHKDVRALAPPPNMPDYEAVRREFTWERARAFLDGLPEGRGLNIAHEAVDRHAKGATSRAHGLALARQGRRATRHQLPRIVGSDQPLRQCAARARRRRGRARVRSAGPRPRALHRRARRAEGEMRRFAAVFRVRAGADRDAARSRRGPGPRHDPSVVPPQGGRLARTTAQARPCPADRRRRNGAGHAVAGRV